jgi:uncharacterized protein (DUF1015 family)
MTLVGPLRCRLVRPAAALRVAAPMPESLLEAAAAAEARSVAPGAYTAPQPGFFVYQQRHGSHVHTGVVCEVLADAFLDGRVRGHESVQPDRVDALVDYLAAAPARSELVALLHRSGPVVTHAVTGACKGEPAVRFTGADGVEQTVWRVSEESAALLTRELGEGVHYVADGHHRVAAWLRAWQQEGSPSGTGLMCVVYPPGGLHLSAFHRRISGPVDAENLVAFLRKEFDVTAVADPLEASGSFRVYAGGRWFSAAYRGVRPAGAGSLDVALLHDRVLVPVLGVGEQALSRIEIASAKSSLTELTELCDQDGGALFALHPPALAELTDLADRGQTLPPKTTYFAPKPYAGIFLR